MKRPLKILIFITVSLIVLYTFFVFFPLSGLMSMAMKISFGNPGKVDAFVFRNLRYLTSLGVISILLYWLGQSRYRDIIYSKIKSASMVLATHLNLRTLLWLSVVYVVILFYIAVTHYDLGIDEAWYIYYAKTFASTGMPYYLDAAGKIAAIDNISMLPYYLLSFVLFKLGLTDVVDFKFLSALLSVLTLSVMYYVITKMYYGSIAIISMLILVAQPGFGFIASTFFGELTQAGFLFLGLYVWLKNESDPDSRSIWIASLLFALAIHTKFQLIFILVFTLIFLHFSDKRSHALRVLSYTILLTGLFVIIRTIPVYLNDPKLVKNIAFVTGVVAADSPSMSLEFMADKMQLYNRFFPLSVLLTTLSVFYFFMKTQFERFLFIYAAITSFWWIFLYPLSTYRNPFMGLIMLSVIMAILVNKLFVRSKQSKQITVKFVSAVAIFIYVLYGFSANLIYAYIGYNDGVQFDLDGNRNRLFSNFSNIVHDRSQEEFHKEAKKLLRPLDTLYNGSFVTACYLDNPVSSISKLKESLQNNNPGKRYVLVTRENYPLGLEKGRWILDSLNVNWKLELKKGDFELYSVYKQ